VFLKDRERDRNSDRYRERESGTFRGGWLDWDTHGIGVDGVGSTEVGTLIVGMEVSGIITNTASSA
jgi:hypothetical protein